MNLYKLSGDIDIKRYLKQLHVDDGGIGILASKAQCQIFRITNLHVGAANILKQDALSIGADLAVPKGTVTAKEPYVDALLIANKRHLKILAQKELSQPFGLKEVAARLKQFINTQVPKQTQLMGIINANDDSFFQASRFKDAKAISKVYEMIENGATIIDIGGVSSRPGSLVVSADEELDRVKPIVDILYKKALYGQVKLSIDSYEPKVISYVLERGFGIVNDITGLQNDEVCRLCASYDATAVIMHMQKNPQEMQKAPYYENVVLDVDGFFANRIQKAKHFGIQDIVLDVGIGFGKTLSHNAALINNLSHFLHFNKPLLIGASRKSMIGEIVKADVSDRLAGTLAIHLRAARQGASILRVHDVYEHYQALKIDEYLNNE